jgi:uncharacterized Zn finger protein
MSYWSGGYGGWAPRKTAAQRRAEAARQIQDAARRGRAMSPISIAGRKIAQTFWGQAWCDNLERYRDFAYRLERGRSYVRSGSVLDLKIEAGKIVAKVSGSSLYDVAIEIDAVQRDAWRAIQRDCAGGVGSRLDLLAGRLSEPVMTRLCADRTGMFPAPAAIRFTCSCPDYATMCKHVAAAMYGVGARLDHAPELLFTLRRVSLDELLASAVSALPATPSGARVLAADGLAALFGIELAEPAAQATGKPTAGSRSKPAPIAGNAAVTAPTKPASRATARARTPRNPPARRSATNTAANATKPVPEARRLTARSAQPAPLANKSAPRTTSLGLPANDGALLSAPRANRVKQPATPANKTAHMATRSAKQPATPLKKTAAPPKRNPTPPNKPRRR